MKKLLLVLTILLFSIPAYADLTNPTNSLEWTEEDGSPSIYDPYKIKLSNTTLTDNADGTISIASVLVPRTSTVADSATPTPNVATTDVYTVTALAQAATFGAPTGTPVNGQRLIIRILDNGTARALAWNAIYVSRGVTLPTTTVVSKYLYCGFLYNSTATKWDLVALSQEA